MRRRVDIIVLIDDRPGTVKKLTQLYRAIDRAQERLRSRHLHPRRCEGDARAGPTRLRTACATKT
jgi:hypothetical protein